MDARTDQVRRDIERIRGDLGQTLEALGDRVAPGKVAARTKEKVADRVDDVREHLSPSRAVKRQSRKLGDGLRNLMGSDHDNRARNVTGVAGDVAGRAAGAAGDVAGRAARVAGDVTGTAAGVASDVTGRAARVAGDVTGTAAGVASSAVEAAQSAPRVLQERATGNPLAFGLLTFASGFLLASILPPTEREQQASQRIKSGLRPAVDEALERGRAVAGELGQSAQEGLEEVKRSAADAAERVKAEAVESAKEVKDQAQVGASEVKEEVQEAAGRLKSSARAATATVTDEAGEPDDVAGRAGHGAPAAGIRATSRPRPLRAPSRGGPPAAARAR